jgi:regulator of replication initiation timing
MSGAAGGASHGSVVSVVGNVPSCVPGGRDGLREDLQIGVDESGRWVVLLKQLVQCARIVKASAALNALATDGASLARKLGHGDALQTATWGNHNKQRTCDVKHVPAVLQWAVEGHGGINVLGHMQRDELAAAVHKAACDLAATRLTLSRDAMADSIGDDIAGVDAEVNRLLTDLHSAKAQAEDVITELQHMHTELSGVREEARSELAEEARWRTQLQQDLADLKAELQGAQQEPAHMHSPGPLLEVEGDASMNETRDQVI